MLQCSGSKLSCVVPDVWLLPLGRLRMQRSSHAMMAACMSAVGMACEKVTERLHGTVDPKACHLYAAKHRSSQQVHCSCHGECVGQLLPRPKPPIAAFNARQVTAAALPSLITGGVP